MRLHNAVSLGRGSILCALLALGLTGTLGCGGRANSTTVVLDGTSGGRIFDGIGAVSAGASSRLLVDYPEPYRSQILDYLFKPDYGASLQHLKVEIGSDVNSTDGSEPSHERSRADLNFTRGYEWWLMEEARKRNPNIILDSLPWGAPGWVGNGHYYSPDMANYVGDFLKGAKSQHQLAIAYTGIWNERQFDAAYVKELHGVLGLQAPATRIVCCDEYPGEGLGQWSIVDAMAKDPALAAAVDVIGVHYPQQHGRLTTPDSARKLGKPLWSTEDQPNSGGGPIVSRDWQPGGRILAQLYNRNYLEGALTATEIWSPVTSYYDILAAPNSGLMYANTPWSGFYDVQSTIWVTAHTTQFASPGWQYLDSASGRLPAQGDYVALKSTNGKDWSVILQTIGAKKPQTVAFAIKGGLAASTVHVWETNSRKTFEHVADIAPRNGRFSLSFDADSLYSLTTTTGQAKGTARPPANTPFPLPYREDFETTALDRAPRFLADQDGAFEVHPCLRRAGRCLEQVITEKPIPWDALPDPFTLAGDANWSNYRLAVDALLSQGPVTLIGRIDSANVFRDRKALWPSGYVLRLTPDGKWSVYSTAYKQPSRTLASGNLRLPAQRWHHLELSFTGNKIAASVDRHPLATVEDESHKHGMFAVGTGWNRAQFDNLSVVPNPD